ncbi:MAG: mechanosensitive ion channel family protein, partial [Burkholderiales bacterium]
MKNYLASIGVPEQWLNISETTAHVLLILFFAWIVLKVAKKAIKLLQTRMLHRTRDAESLKRIGTLSQVFRYIVSVVVWVITFMLVLDHIGISIAPILAAAGVVGLAVGFGAQSLVKDFFTGFFLLLENQVRQGDVIEAGGKSGLVEHITLRYIQMRDYDGNVHFVPNSTITT